MAIAKETLKQVTDELRRLKAEPANDPKALTDGEVEILKHLATRAGQMLRVSSVRKALHLSDAKSELYFARLFQLELIYHNPFSDDGDELTKIQPQGLAYLEERNLI